MMDTPTKKRVTLSDIAAAAKISVPAVSMALADHPQISLSTRRKVWEISRRLGYQYRKRRSNHAASRQRRPRRLAFVALGTSLSRPIVASYLLHVTTFSSSADIRMEAACVEDLSNPRDVFDRVKNIGDRNDGIVLTNHVESELVDAMSKSGIPFVLLGDAVGDTTANVNVVTYDHQAAGRLLTRHLLAKGHRRIAFVCDTLPRFGSNSRWLDGCRLAHMELKLHHDPALVVVSRQIDAGGVDTLIAALDQPDRPTAVLSVNSFQTNAIAAELRRRDRFLELCCLRSKLTDPATAHLPCVVYSSRDLCDAALKRLFLLWERPDEPPVKTLVPFTTANLDPV